MRVDAALDFVKHRCKCRMSTNHWSSMEPSTQRGFRDRRQLATDFSRKIEALLREMEDRIEKMPLPVLSRHGLVRKTGDLVELELEEKLNLQQRSELLLACELRLHDYVQRRGLKIWDYRILDDSVPASQRYRVLAESGGRCALCGAHAKDVPLNVDHFVPRSKGGTSDFGNLQALCYRCNRGKGNADDRDFREIDTSEVE